MSDNNNKYKQKITKLTTNKTACWVSGLLGCWTARHAGCCCLVLAAGLVGCCVLAAAALCWLLI